MDSLRQENKRHFIVGDEILVTKGTLRGVLMLSFFLFAFVSSFSYISFFFIPSILGFTGRVLQIYTEKTSTGCVVCMETDYPCQNYYFPSDVVVRNIRAGSRVIVTVGVNR